MITPGRQNEYKQLTEAYDQVAQEAGEGNWTPAHKPKRLAANLVKVEAGASAQEMNALRQVVDGLRSGRINLKEVEQGAGTIVVSTGDEKSVILKVMGFEGDHDVPVSLRPDHRPDRDMGGGDSPRERSRREMQRGQTPSRFGPTGDDARDYD